MTLPCEPLRGNCWWTFGRVTVPNSDLEFIFANSMTAVRYDPKAMSNLQPYSLAIQDR